MSDNTNIEAVEESAKAPVVSGPSESEVKTIDAVGDGHPLVQETGSEALKTQTESGAGEFLSDFIYEHDSAWVREWLQNEETACVRAAKLLIRLSDEYPEGWLTHTMWVDAETGDTIIDYDDNRRPLATFADDMDPADLRQIEVPRPIESVLEASRSIGYDPTITWDVYLDEKKIVTEDNGIGMTPYEFDEAFNTIFSSGSGIDGETGGMFGVGSESVALVHGKDGGAECDTYSRRPGGHDGFRAYSYLGGANALPGEVPDGFRGTKFDIPVQDSFDLTDLQEWVEEYAENLRVPLLYREHDAGATPVEEEYEATVFTESRGEDPPIVIDRPGEFSLVAGPEVYDDGYHSDDENTYLVSMHIDRNKRRSMKTLWDVVIQVHDEQGRIVHGPHRGLHEDDVDQLHDDDVVTPQPTGSRDSFQRDDQTKQFWKYIESEVKEQEVGKAGAVAEEMADADHPADPIMGEKAKWRIFRKVVSKHGSYRSRSKFNDFITGDEYGHIFPDYEDTTEKRIYKLFKEVGHVTKGPSKATKKYRGSPKLGKFLAENDPDEVYMAASVSGNFADYFKVARNTHDSMEVVVVDSASKYNTWNNHFGWKKIKDVPLKQDDDHDFDVPDSVHERNTRSSSSSSSNTTEATEDRVLKLRTDGDNSSIDRRYPISKIREKLSGGGTIDGHEKLILYTKGDGPNISDNYGMADHAVIASASKKERETLTDLDAVITHEEFEAWSNNQLIATEDGPMRPATLLGDDRLVVLLYAGSGLCSLRHKVMDVFSNDDLREMVSNDAKDQKNWTKILPGFDGSYGGQHRGVEAWDCAKPDTLVAVADHTVLSRAEYAFEQLDTDVNQHDGSFGMVCLKLGHSKFGYRNPSYWQSLSGSLTEYRLKLDTPNWDNDSNVYGMMPANKDKPRAQVYLGLHDRGINPAKCDPENLRDLIAGEDED
jgi:hypothetical protein